VVVPFFSSSLARLPCNGNQRVASCYLREIASAILTFTKAGFSIIYKFQSWSARLWPLCLVGWASRRDGAAFGGPEHVSNPSLHKPDASKVCVAHVACCISCQAWEIAGCPALLKTPFKAASKPSASLQLHTVIVDHHDVCQFGQRIPGSKHIYIYLFKTSKNISGTGPIRKDSFFLCWWCDHVRS